MSLKFCLLDADYVMEDVPVIRLFGVDESGKSVIVLDRMFRPYFYSMPDKKIETLLKKSKMVTGMEHTKKRLGMKDVDVLKVFVDSPPNVPAVRDIIKQHTDCYEYNINFYKRYMIDNRFYPLEWLEVSGDVKECKGFDCCIEAFEIKKSNGGKPRFRIMAFDIEVVDGKIIMISLAGSGFRKVITYKKAKNAFVVKNEKELLEEFVETVNKHDPDIIVGYNSDGFDFEVLANRSRDNKVEMRLGRNGEMLRFARRVRSSSAKIMGRVHIDLFAYVNNLMAQQLQSEIFTLNEVAKELIGEGKEEATMDDIISMWKNDTDRLADYCEKDSVLALKLSENILIQIFELSRVSGQLPFDTCRSTFGLLSEWFLLRKAGEKNIIAPNNPHWDEIQERRARSFAGGYVKEPVQGLHENIDVFDFRSLYPSVIATFNISPETLTRNKPGVYKVPEHAHAFLKKPRGFVSETVKELIERRREIKSRHPSSEEERKEINEHQFALKILANATYGMLGNGGARWYSRECAESAAAYGRFYIKETISKAEKSGFVVLYGDTDSLFVKKQNGRIEKTAEEFLEKINKELPGMLELELQGIYVKGLFVPQRLGAYTAKKRYALIDKQGNLTIRGLETVRRDWCILARQLQHDVIRLVLSGKEKEAVKKVHETVSAVRKRKIDLKDVAIQTQLGKSLDEYKAVGPHVAVARKLQKEGHEIREGMVLSYIITKGDKKASISSRAEPADRVKIEDYDADYYINNQVLSVALRVLSVLGYKEEDFIENNIKLKRFAVK